MDINHNIYKMPSESLNGYIYNKINLNLLKALKMEMIEKSQNLNMNL